MLVDASRDRYRWLAERYAAALDAADGDAALALFAPGGGLTVCNAAGRELITVRDEKLAAFPRLLGRTYRSTLHHVTTQSLDGDRGTTWCIAHHVTPDWTLETVGVRYADTLDGDRFAQRRASALWVKVEPLPKTGLRFDQVVQEELA
jgi:hypothetical protein